MSSILSSTGVIERWELLQAQDLSKEIRTKQNQQQWQQLNSDLNNVWAWLGATEDELEEQRRLDLCTDIQKIEQRIKKLKVLSFSAWLPTTRCVCSCLLVHTGQTVYSLSPKYAHAGAAKGV